MLSSESHCTVMEYCTKPPQSAVSKSKEMGIWPHFEDTVLAIFWRPRKETKIHNQNIGYFVRPESAIYKIQVKQSISEVLFSIHNEIHWISTLIQY